MVDKFVLAKLLADVRDAVARIREVLPPDVAAFESDEAHGRSSHSTCSSRCSTA